MKCLLECFIFGLLSCVLTNILIPYLRTVAIKLCLVDLPNYRKVHSQPVPLLGGVVLGLVFFALGSISGIFFNQQLQPVLFGSYLILLVGIVDDKMDIRAIYKLVIQLCLGFILAHSGIRITSMYGLFGITEITPFFQYLFTILALIVSVNAFNLMDGIDGLASSIALSGFIFLLIASFLLSDYDFVLDYIILIGALLLFLRYNFSQKNKIFLGDSGSLFLGFLLISFGIRFMESHASMEAKELGLLYFLFVFLLPIMDTLRVFVGRISRQSSPFKPDKTHLHHYLMRFEISHKKITLSILVMNLLLLFTAVLLIGYHNVNYLFASVLLVLSFYKILGILTNFLKWKQRVNELEQANQYQTKKVRKV